VVKLSPDLDDARLENLVRALAASPASGVILGNTTTARLGLRSGHAAEPGGLSGRPLLERTLRITGRSRSAAGPGFTIIASGGIGSPEAVGRVLEEGADLAQLWTGMIYAGPGLIGEAVAASST
jgi:dihydroorotate dehydrogenase